MKFIILIFITSATLAMTIKNPEPPTRHQPSIDPAILDTAQRLHHISKYKDQVTYDEHLLYVATVHRWARQLDMGQHWKMAVALFYTESGFRTNVTDLDSVGISQVRAKYRGEFSKHLPDGFMDGFDPWNYEHQIAIGMAGLKQKMIESRLAGGGINAAVRFYNGRGKGGFNHLWKVKRDYKLIFGDQHGLEKIAGGAAGSDRSG